MGIKQGDWRSDTRPGRRSVPEPFQCIVEPRRGAVRIHVRGELDLDTADTLEASLRELHEVGFDRIELDLAALMFIDSTGLHLLIRWSELSARDGSELRVTRCSPQVRRLFEITAVTDLIPPAEPDPTR